MIARHLKRESVPKSILAPETIEILKAQEWTGNVRQLANVMEHSAILSDGICIRPEDLPQNMIRGAQHSTPTTSDAPAGLELSLEPKTLREMEDQMILHVLKKHDGDKPSTAKELGIALKTLYNRLSQLEERKEAG